MKASNRIGLFILLVFTTSYCSSQTIASGESSIYKKGNEVKAYYEAVENAQRNAIIIYGGNISYNSSQAISNTKIASKENSDNKYASSDNFVKEFQSLFGEAINSTIKTKKILRVDTIKVGYSKFKIRITGEFAVNTNEATSIIGIHILKSGKQVRIAVRENNCQGDIYKYISEYFNRKRNNFIFSKEEWPLLEDDYLLEINSNEIVLKSKQQKPNIILKTYNYDGCINIIKNLGEDNKLFDDIINDIYLLYVTQLGQRKK